MGRAKALSCGVYRSQTENITIAGNAYVKAYGVGDASGIGGGYKGNAKNIIIRDNAYVVAEGFGGGAGIGSGYGGGSSDVKIWGGTVVAEGSYTGIGGHYRDSDTPGASCRWRRQRPCCGSPG